MLAVQLYIINYSVKKNEFVIDAKRIDGQGRETVQNAKI